MAVEAKSGKLVLVQLGTGVTATTIATAKQNSLTINNSVVDTTTKKENGWGSTLSGGGVREMTTTLEGIYHNTEYDRTLRNYGMDGTSNEYTIINGHGDKWEGKFVITSYGVGGEMGGAETFTASLKNDGEIVYTQGAV